MCVALLVSGRELHLNDSNCRSKILEFVGHFCSGFCFSKGERTLFT